MNEAEASKKAKEMIAERIFVYCPLMKGICVTSCECYKMPEVILRPLLTESELIKDEGYFVHGGFCDCYALKGASD